MFKSMFCVKSRIARLFTCIVHTEFRDREGVYVVTGSFLFVMCRGAKDNIRGRYQANTRDVFVQNFTR